MKSKINIYCITFKSNGHQEWCEYEGDIFIEVESAFNDSGYALECQAWAEEAKKGDVYEDENLTITVCE